MQTRAGQGGSDRFGNPAALGCPHRPFLLSPRAPFPPFWQFLRLCACQQLSPFLSFLRALLPADIPASLSLRVPNEEVIAERVMTAHALLVGRFPSSGK